jgi:signal transduction histidine kinase
VSREPIQGGTPAYGWLRSQAFAASILLVSSLLVLVNSAGVGALAKAVGLGGSLLLLAYFASLAWERAGGLWLAPAPSSARIAADRPAEPSPLLIVTQLNEELREIRDDLAAEAAAHQITENHLRHADRLAKLGALAANLIHELGTPLGVVLGRTKLIQQAEEVPECHRHAKIVGDEARRIIEMVEPFLEFSRLPAMAHVPIDLGEVASRTIDLLKLLPAARNVSIELRLTEERMRCRGDPVGIRQVLSNLLSNALDASSAGDVILVEVGHGVLDPPPLLELESGDFVALKVKDQGTGVAPIILDRIFEPFFTTKAIGEGTGLGLSVSAGIMRDHGGWLTADSSPGAGASFTACLPRVVST